MAWEIDQFQAPSVTAIYVWKVGKWESPAHLRFSDYVEDFVFSPDGAWVAGGEVTGVRLLNLETQQEREIKTGEVYSLDFSPDGKRLVTAGKGTIRFWDFETDEQMGMLDMGNPVNCVRFLSDQQLFYILRDVGARVLDAGQ